MRRVVQHLLWAGFLAVGFAYGAVVSHPCGAEDGAPAWGTCTWYGSQQGNGQGDTLVYVGDTVIVRY